MKAATNVRTKNQTIDIKDVMAFILFLKDLSRSTSLSGPDTSFIKIKLGTSCSTTVHLTNLPLKSHFFLLQYEKPE